MAGKIIINTERCKGCGLCVQVCPKNSIVISTQSNKTGYFPAQPAPSVARSERSRTVEGASNTDCTGCCLCAIICPEAIIEVYRENDTSSKSTKKRKPPLIKKKI